MVITILSGMRHKLLERTLFNLFEKMPQLRDEKIIALNNGNDQPTTNILNYYKVKHLVTSELLPIGPAVSRLALEAYSSGEKYWLHIEDDWQAVDGGIEGATEILDTFEDISQVRLRHISETVLKKHMITGVPIIWEAQGGFKTAKAHYTFNPSIIRTADISKIFPCTGERHAQKNWLFNGLVAQLDPGIFKHIGEGQSLRLETGAEV